MTSPIKPHQRLSTTVIRYVVVAVAVLPGGLVTTLAKKPLGQQHKSRWQLFREYLAGINNGMKDHYP